MNKVVIKILQGSVVSQTVRWAKYISFCCQFPIVYTCQNYENWLEVEKIIATISRLTFWPSCISH